MLLFLSSIAITIASSVESEYIRHIKTSGNSSIDSDYSLKLVQAEVLQMKQLAELGFFLLGSYSKVSRGFSLECFIFLNTIR